MTLWTMVAAVVAGLIGPRVAYRVRRWRAQRAADRYLAKRVEEFRASREG